MRCSRGQATVDHVAIVALVGALLAGGVALTSAAAPGVVNAVVGGMRHALCLVAGRPCPDPRPRPCPVATTREARALAVTILLLRVGDDRLLLRERMSDGSVRLTVVRGAALGVEGGVGGRLTVTAGRRLGAGAEARAGGEAVVRAGRVYVARDARAAAAIERALRAGRAPPVAPRELLVDAGVRGLARVGLGGASAGAWLQALPAATLGARHDRASGELTLQLDARGTAWGALAAALAGLAGDAQHALTVGLTLDRRRRPVALSVAAAGALAGGAMLPLGVQRALDGAPGAAVASAGAAATGAGGRRWELAARAELSDPLVAGAWRRVRAAPASAEALRALGEAIRARGRLDARVYRTRSSATGIAAGVGAGLRLGAEHERVVDEGRLVAASTRPPAGLWEPRSDCLPA